jgi:hypothetical protein
MELFPTGQFDSLLPQKIRGIGMGEKLAILVSSPRTRRNRTKFGVIDSAMDN